MLMIECKSTNENAAPGRCASLIVKEILPCLRRPGWVTNMTVHFLRERRPQLSRLLVR